MNNNSNKTVRLVKNDKSIKKPTRHDVDNTAVDCSYDHLPDDQHEAFHLAEIVVIEGLKRIQSQLADISEKHGINLNIRFKTSSTLINSD